jgi:hypothetical protein
MVRSSRPAAIRLSQVTRVWKSHSRNFCISDGVESIPVKVAVMDMARADDHESTTGALPPCRDLGPCRKLLTSFLMLRRNWPFLRSGQVQTTPAHHPTAFRTGKHIATPNFMAFMPFTIVTMIRLVLLLYSNLVVLFTRQFSVYTLSF